MNRTITAHAVQARLTLSKTMLDFGPQIVLRSNQVKPPYSLDLLLSSNEAIDISWHMAPPSCEGQEGCKGVFAVEPESGTLASVRKSFAYPQTVVKSTLGVIPGALQMSRGRALQVLASLF